MALVFADRVKDSSTTTGTGTFTITGTAATGYQTFNSGIGVGNTCYYCIAGQAGSTDPTEWEVGLGTLATATTITRSSGNVLSSSSGAGTLVTFSAGVKDVFVTSPALWATSPSFTSTVGVASQLNLTNASNWNLYASGAGANYMLGQLAIGTTTLTNGFLAVTATQSNSAYSIYLSGTNSNASTTIGGLYNSGSFTGASATTVYGFNNQPTVTGAAATSIYGINSVLTYNANAATTLYGITTQVGVGAAALGGSTIANLYGMQVQAPSINGSATTTITNVFQLRTERVTKGAGQTITNAYSLYADQATGSATNSWNLYAAGNAPNYMLGQLTVGATALTGQYSGYICVNPSTNSVADCQMIFAGNNATASTTLYALRGYVGFNSTTATTVYGFSNTPSMSGASIATAYGIYNTISYLANAATTLYGMVTKIDIGAASLGGSTIGNLYSYLAQTPTINGSATTTITNAYQFYAQTINKGTLQTITNAYAYYGNQGTGSATNSWNLYMAGAAPNYMLGQLSIGSTTLTGSTSGFLNLIGTQSTVENQMYIGGTNSTAQTTLTGIRLNPTYSGSTTTFVYGMNNIVNYDANALTNFYGYSMQLRVTASAAGGSTIGTMIAYEMQSPFFSTATTTVTNCYGFYASSINHGSAQTITNAYAFYGNQVNTASGATNNWNLYMAGAAPNYLAGQLSIGTTALTNGFFTLNTNSSSAAYYIYVSGNNSNTSGTLGSINNQPTISGASATVISGLKNSPTITGAAAGAIYGIDNSFTYNANAAGAIYGTSTVISIGAAALGGSTIGNMWSYAAQSPLISGSATTTITNAFQYYADNISKGTSQTITNAYAFYGNQGTGSATNSWNLYAAGNAPNYLAGQLAIGTTTLTNGFLTVNVNQSSAAAYLYIGGTNTNSGASLISVNLKDTITGTTAVTNATAINLGTTLSLLAGTAISNFNGIQHAMYLSGSAVPSNYFAFDSSPQITATVGTVSNFYQYSSSSPYFNASTVIFTNYYSFYHKNVAGGGTSSTVGTVYAFYGNQASSNSGVTNNWNLYMNGTAPNYLAGTLNVGSTTLTNAPVYFALSTSLQYNFMMQGTNTYSTASGTPIGMYINPNINGIASSVSMVGLSATPIFGPVTSAVVSSLYGIIGNSYLNTANAPTTVTLAGIRGLFTLASAVSTRAVANGYAFYADTPSISSTSTVTTVAGFYAENITKGSGTITNAYAFYGNQATGSATNSWNFYAAGAAPNYLNSNLLIGTTTVPSTAANIVLAGLIATSAAAPTIASATTIAPTTQIVFISGTTAIATITAPNPISAGGGQITLIPTGAFTTTTAGNIALASTAVVSKALIMTYDTTTAKWYPSY